MKTLFITFSYLKGNRGGIYASKTHINLFAELSEKMILLYPYKNGMEPEGVLSDIIKMIPVEDYRSKARKYVDLCFGIQHRFIHIAKSFFNDRDVDTIVFDGSVTSSRLIEGFKKKGKRVITLHHNYEINYLKADASSLTKPLDLFWTRRHEGTAVKLSDLNITLAKQDIDLLRNHYCKEAVFDHLGVYDFKRCQQVKWSNRDRGHHYLITGGLGSKQNEDSLIPWLNTYYPILKEVDPKAKLTLAGRSPSFLLKETAKKKGINIIDTPENMDDVLETGDYYVCPTDRGGGIKLRVMDGLKGGMPVITHVVSARGYEEMENNGIVFSYKDKNSFEDALREMLRSTVSRHDIQKQYYNTYSFDNGKARLLAILKKAQIL